MSQSEKMQEDIVLISQNQGLKTIMLNRPRAINAINLEMVDIMTAAIDLAQTDGTEVILIQGSGERGLSGGGDIKEMAANNAKDATVFIRREYELDLKIAKSKVPVVAIMAGITMGGGIGISGHAALRIVTDDSRLAMPEVKIGIVPDVGGHLLLAETPGRTGEYLALTAGSFGADDAVASGFADFYIPKKNLEAFVLGLASAGSTIEDLYEYTAGFSQELAHGKLAHEMSWANSLIDEALGSSTDVTIETASADGAVALADWAVDSLQRLIIRCENSSLAQERDFGQILRGMSPTSLAVTLAQLARTRALSLGLEEVLNDDLRVLSRMFLMPDFVEGVRALAIDKDQNPNWKPGLIEDLDPIVISRIIDPS